MSYIPETTMDCITEAEMSLRKGILILTDITEKYPFCGNISEHIHTWTFDYRRIATLVDIAADYMAEASVNLNRATKIENE